PHVAQAVAARLAIALLLPVVGKPVADPDPPVAPRTEQKHVGNIDRHLLGEPPPLGILLAGPHVLVHAVDALDDDLVPRRQDAEHLGAPAIGGRALVVAGDHLDLVIFANVHGILSRIGPASAPGDSPGRGPAGPRRPRPPG